MKSSQSLRWSCHDIEIIPAWLAEHDLGPADEVLAATGDLSLQATWGYRRLAEFEASAIDAFGRWRLQNHGMAVIPDHAMIVPGISYGVSLAVRAMTSPKCAVVIPTPNFPALAEVASCDARKVLAWPLVRRGSAWAYDIDALAELAHPRSGVEAIVLSNPNNPTGYSMNEGEANAIAEFAAARNLCIVIDEALVDLVASPRSTASILDHSTRGASCYSAVKAHSLGDVRIAFVHFIGHEDELRARKILDSWHWRPDSTGLVLTIAALEQGAKAVARTRQRLAVDWEHLKSALPQSTTRWLPKDGLVGLLSLEDLGIPDDRIEQAVQNGARVALRGPHRFFGGVRGHPRISVGLPREEMDRMARQLGHWITASSTAARG